MTENMKKLLDIPIDPDVLRASFDECDWALNKNTGNQNVITRRADVVSECFVFLHSLAGMIYKGTMWNKKARIVLEYDPDKNKMAIFSVMERDEAIQMEPFSKWIQDGDHQ